MVVKDTEAEAAVDAVAAADVDVVADIIHNLTKSNKTNIPIRSFSRTNSSSSNYSNKVIQELIRATAGLTAHADIPRIFAMRQRRAIVMMLHLKTEWQEILKIVLLDGVG